jgi:hypothetical protein
MIERIKRLIRAENYRFTLHGFERCVERRISPNEVKCAILSGEVIEEKYYMCNVLLTLSGLSLRMTQL